MDQATTLLDLLRAHEWLPLFALGVSWATALCSRESLFPVSFTRRWLPLVAVSLSMASSGVKAVIAGDTWVAWALHSALTAFLALGGYAVVIKSVFNDNPPAWLNVFALIFDPKTDAKKGPPPAPPGISVGILLVGLACACCFVANTTACTPAVRQTVIADLTPAASCIVGALAEGGASDPMLIVAECAGTTIADVIKVIGDLLENAPDAGAVADGGLGLGMSPSWRAHLVDVLQRAYAVKAKAAP